MLRHTCVASSAFIGALVLQRRLEPFNQDVEDQVSHLLAKIITPQMEVPMKYSSFDAYSPLYREPSTDGAKLTDPSLRSHRPPRTQFSHIETAPLA